jgi:hypothetical protein
MNTRLTKMVSDAGGRFLDANERQELLGWAAAVPERVRAALAMETAEADILKATVEEMKRRYPNFGRYHEQAWAKLYRDLQLVYRQSAHAMVMDDLSLLEDNLLYWLRSMLAAVNVTPAFVRDSYEQLRANAQRSLDSTVFGAVESCLNRAVEVLVDFAEPAAAAV